MALIPNVWPWDSQPQEAVGVDWSNPLTAGLTVLNVGNSRINLVDGSDQAEGGEWPSVVTPGGIAMQSATAIRGRYWHAPQTPRGQSTIFSAGVAIAGAGTVVFGSYAGPQGENTGYLLAIDAGAFRLYTYPGYSQANTTSPAQDSVFTCAAVGDSTNQVQGWLNGQPFGSTLTIFGTNLGRAGPSQILTSQAQNDAASSLVFASWARSLSPAELRSLHANPWQLFAPRRIWVPQSGGAGPVTHDTSGALAGAGATTAGVAARIGGAHATSGALAGAGGVIAGAAARTRAHPSSGALAGSGAVASGVTRRFRALATSGALSGSGAITAGIAARTRVHAATGVLLGAGAITAGSATRAAPGTHPTSGTLVGAGAITSGAATRRALHITTGALSGAGAVTAGVAARIRAAVTHATSGALFGAGGQLQGAASGPIVPSFDQVLAIPRFAISQRTGEVFPVVLGDDNTPVGYVGRFNRVFGLTLIANSKRSSAFNALGEVFRII